MTLAIKGKGKAVQRKRRHFRLRKKISGTALRPRLVVTRSTRHMVAQIVDDTQGKTLASASTLEADVRALKGSDLEFALGFSHPVVVTPPAGITFAVESPTKFSVAGISKQQVGEVAANIRKIRKPEPYKGKGVRYAGEQVRRKAGKTGK